MKQIFVYLLFFTALPLLGQDFAPHGYYTEGNKVYDAQGLPVQFKGVNRPSLEWGPRGKYMIESDIQAIAATGANIVRIPLNQQFWLSNQVAYQATVDSVIAWSMKADLRVILDLHWSQKNDPTETAAAQMHADEISLDFWYQVALKYKDNGEVLFELYNEPHKITWDEIVKGGINDNGTEFNTADDWTMVGYQALYDTVRAAGAHNLVIIGGNNWTFDLSYYETNPIAGYNIIYASHCYPFSTKLADNWHQWTTLAKSYPVIISEFGPKEFPEDTSYVQELMDTINAYGAHWTAWAWYPFSANNLWENTFNPETNTYDTTTYGKWVIGQLLREDEDTTATALTPQTSTIQGVTIVNNHLSFSDNKRYTVQVLSAKGQLLSEFSGVQKSLSLKGLALGTGVYQLRIQGGTTLHTQQLRLK